VLGPIPCPRLHPCNLLSASVSPPYVPSHPHTRLKILSVAGQSCEHALAHALDDHLWEGKKALKSASVALSHAIVQTRSETSILSPFSYFQPLCWRQAVAMSCLLSVLIRPSSFYFWVRDSFQVHLGCGSLLRRAHVAACAGCRSNGEGFHGDNIVPIGTD
jgi:hypothetical protein